MIFAIKTIRLVLNNGMICFFLSFLNLLRKERTVAGRNDPRVSFVSMKDCFPDMNYPNKYFGCDGHPSKLGATFMTDIIWKAIQRSKK